MSYTREIMEAQTTTLLQTLSFSLLLLQAHSTRFYAPAPPKSDIQFVISLCKGTTYSTLCYDSLSPHAAAVWSNHWKLCNRAMWVTLQAARSSMVLVYGLSKRHGGMSESESEVIGVCMESVMDGADRVRQSMRAMGVGELKRSNFAWQVANVMTWMSAVITDMDTCAESLAEMKVRPELESNVAESVEKVEKLASNALSLINTLQW